MTARDHKKTSDLRRGPKRTPPKVRQSPGGVTDHAMVRYMERVMGVDTDSVRRAILTPENKAMIAKLKSGKFPLGHGLVAIVKDEVIVTIVTA